MLLCVFGDIRNCTEIQISRKIISKKPTYVYLIPASSDIVESERRQMKQCWIQYIQKNLKKSPCLYVSKLKVKNRCQHTLRSAHKLTIFSPLKWRISGLIVFLKKFCQSQKFPTKMAFYYVKDTMSKISHLGCVHSVRIRMKCFCTVQIFIEKRHSYFIM